MCETRRAPFSGTHRAETETSPRGDPIADTIHTSRCWNCPDGILIEGTDEAKTVHDLRNGNRTEPNSRLFFLFGRCIIVWGRIGRPDPRGRLRLLRGPSPPRRTAGHGSRPHLFVTAQPWSRSEFTYTTCEDGCLDRDRFQLGGGEQWELIGGNRWLCTV